MIEVTLRIPDEIYEEAVATAEREQRPVEEVLVEQHFTTPPSPFYVDPRHDQMVEEKAAFETKRAELWETYPNEYVAFRGGRMVDHDPDELALVKRVQVNYPEAVVLITQVRPVAPPPLNFRSALWKRA